MKNWTRITLGILGSLIIPSIALRLRLDYAICFPGCSDRVGGDDFLSKGLSGGPPSGE